MQQETNSGGKARGKADPLFVYLCFKNYLANSGLLYFLKILLFLERKGRTEGEKHHCVGDSLIGCFSHPQLGTRPSTQACALILQAGTEFTDPQLPGRNSGLL